jgi:hypothetical protein
MRTTWKSSAIIKYVEVYQQYANKTFNIFFKMLLDIYVHIIGTGTAVAQWLRYCATNQKVAVSIPYGVIIGTFH